MAAEISAGAARRGKQKGLFLLFRLNEPLTPAVWVGNAGHGALQGLVLIITRDWLYFYQDRSFPIQSRQEGSPEMGEVSDRITFS